MTWSIYASGNPDQVKKQSEDANVYDQAGGVATKALVAAVCDAIPQGIRDEMEVSVQASGHSDQNHHTLAINLKAQPRSEA